ncbi:MAG TPA: dTMP kinase [Peptococcaceae bacterium]|nr:dTMP kinase [Peptococcaceae bacterium]
MEQSQGKLIVLEGIDGSGISTQTVRLKNFLETKYGLKVVLTKEPSDGPIGTIIRQILSGRVVGVSASSLALLFAADRLDHNNNKIKPALRQGDYVICDRYIWSSFAYQGMQNDISWIKEINKYAYKPDLTIFIKVRPETSLKRILGSRFQTEIFEKVEILEQVLANYIKIFTEWKDLGEEVRVINGEQEPNLVEMDIALAVEQFLQNNQLQRD